MQEEERQIRIPEHPCQLRFNAINSKVNMKLKRVSSPLQERSLPKCPTGIAGFDEITLGGLPRGRPTLICGGAGCGKTLFGIEFLARGAQDFGEPGVCISFEENS